MMTKVTRWNEGHAATLRDWRSLLLSSGDKWVREIIFISQMEKQKC